MKDVKTFLEEYLKKEDVELFEKIYKATDNSYVVDMDFNDGHPTGLLGKPQYYRIIGSVYIPVRCNTYSNKVIVLDTAIQNVKTGEIYYVKKNITIPNFQMIAKDICVRD